MAYKVIKSKGSISGLTKRNFIVDTAAEISDLPTNTKVGKTQTGDTVSDEKCAIGSIATVSETGDTYELNASGTWVRKPVEGTGDGSDITIDSTLTQVGQAADAKAVGDKFDEYTNNTALESTYAKKTDLSGYATTESLASYIQTATADGKYATKSELGSYATTASLADYAKTSELPKGTAVTDATGETDAHTQLNALLASLRAAGIIASS